MKTKTADLIGPALDWAVAKCIFGQRYGDNDLVLVARRQRYSSEWAQGGPIIEREGISLRYLCVTDDPFRWAATQKPTIKNVKPGSVYGPTPLIAAMRCVVAANLGDEVDVPDELV